VLCVSGPAVATERDGGGPRAAETRGRSDKVKERRARIEVIALSDGGAPGEERYPSIVPVHFWMRTGPVVVRLAEKAINVNVNV
jgi:hypothetical protein